MSSMMISREEEENAKQPEVQGRYTFHNKLDLDRCRVEDIMDDSDGNKSWRDSPANCFFFL